MLLYSLLHLTGYEDMTLDQLKHFRQVGSKTAGHPEYGHATGIETTTGPLGQGLANSVGFALGRAASWTQRFGNDLVDHYTYVHRRRRLPDGRRQPRGDRAGRPPEAQQADRAVCDDNGISIDGPISLADNTEDQSRPLRRLPAGTRSRIDGHRSGSHRLCDPKPPASPASRR